VKDVLAPIIKRLESVSVYPIKILQPHGRSSLYITNSHSRFDLGYHHTLPDEFKHFQRIAGDTSAFDIVNCQNSVYRQFPLHFVKTRKEHEISLHIPDSQYHEIKNDERPILIMDDLCDGGATFIVEAEYLRDSKLLGDRKLYLFVYHGLFTNGLDTLLKHFDRIYTTNSYRDYPALDQLKVIDVWS
jgi:phosphoribosylpyrophosphate synthetase